MTGNDQTALDQQSEQEHVPPSSAEAQDVADQADLDDLDVDEEAGGEIRGGFIF
jgi:hypothetical protein